MHCRGSSPRSGVILVLAIALVCASCSKDKGVPSALRPEFRILSQELGVATNPEDPKMLPKELNERLYYSAGHGTDDMVVWLLTLGADPNIFIPNNNGNMTALQRAAREGKAVQVTKLLEKGASVEARSAGGSTALHFAAEGGSLPTVKVLVEHGAKLDALDDADMRPADIAKKTGNVQLLKVLDPPPTSATK
jgi:ankyrin repeat protein